MINEHNCPDDYFCVIKRFVVKSRHFLGLAVPAPDNHGDERDTEDGTKKE